jgi:hypothetical protein
MALMTCGGADVLRGAVHFPARAAWWARLELDAAKPLSGQVTIAAAGGWTLQGSVLTAGVFCDVAHVQVVGGAGGLGKLLSPAAYQNAQLRDPLDAILKASGETLSSTTLESVLAVELADWTVLEQRPTTAIDALCTAASQALGSSITWRVLADGTVWLGSETWPTQQLPNGSDVLEVFPADGRYVLGVETPALLPGVNLADVGNVAAVDHWITHDEVRTWVQV